MLLPALSPLLRLAWPESFAPHRELSPLRPGANISKYIGLSAPELSYSEVPAVNAAFAGEIFQLLQACLKSKFGNSIFNMTASNTIVCQVKISCGSVTAGVSDFKVS